MKWSILAFLFSLDLALSQANATSVVITVTNLPENGATADGQVIAFVGTLNGWNNASTLSTVQQHRVAFAFPDSGSLPLLGSDWTDKPAGANAGFQFLQAGTWNSVIKSDFNLNDGNFRLALADGAANTVEIDAGVVPWLVDQASAVRVNGVVETPVAPIDRTRFAYPGGRWKALIMSYDDGNSQDLGIVPIFNQHGIRGTFHLNSGLMGQGTHLPATQVSSLYPGHEVSCHTVDHPYLDQLDDGSIQYEVGNDCSVLAGLAGYSIHTMSYPFGAYNNRILALLPGLGMTCSRTTQSAYNLGYFPPNPLKWHPTSHHAGAESIAQEFAARTNDELSLLFIWGHSWELDGNQANNSWSYMTSLCATIGDRGDVWYASMGDVNDYLAAIRALTYPATNVIQNPSSRITVWTRPAGSRLIQLRPGRAVAYPPGGVQVLPENLEAGDSVTLHYFPSNALRQAAGVVVRLNEADFAMTPEGDEWTHTFTASTDRLSFSFRDALGRWDDNGGEDWMVAVRPAGTNVPASIQIAPASPLISDRNPSGQNNAGDAFDLDTRGGSLSTTDRGGFGRFGNVYANCDADFLYLGATNCSVGGSNNAMVIFLSVDSLTDGVENVWNLHGTPYGLDKLHNLAVSPAANVAIVIGDEYGDGNFAHFNLSSGYDFGQGIYRLSSASTSFAPVPGARLSQFDGQGINGTASADDDGNRQVDRWEAAIPWSSLGAALGPRSLNSLILSGVIASDGVSGSDRYLSSNTLGLSATGTLDGFGNFGFSFVTLAGCPVGLPGTDSDRDGVTDFAEVVAGTDSGNRDSFLKMGSVDAANSRCNFASVSGRSYRVQYKADLFSPEPWLDLSGEALTASNAASSIYAPMDGPEGFYRVRVVTP